MSYEVLKSQQQSYQNTDFVNFFIEIQTQQIKLNKFLNKIENFDIEEELENNLSSSSQEGDYYNTSSS